MLSDGKKSQFINDFRLKEMPRLVFPGQYTQKCWAFADWKERKKEIALHEGS